MFWSEEFQLLANALVKFRDLREWEQFHSIKNLVPALSVEAAELLELTQWKSASDLSKEINNAEFRSNFEREIGDVFIYLILICIAAKIDPIDAAYRKLSENELKYPIEKSRGNAIKYSELM